MILLRYFDKDLQDISREEWIEQKPETIAC